MNLDFTGKYVIVTAGGSGIGYEIAKAFEQKGAIVFACDVDAEKITILKARHPNIHGFVANVGNAKEVEAFFSFIQTITPSIHVLVNNAGIAGPTALTANIQPDDWDQTLAVNLNGMFYHARLAIPMIQKSNGGAIINISSSAAYFGYPFRSPYTASKWAVIGFTKTMAMEYGPDNITVNAICPGSVKGQRINSVIEKEAKIRNLTFEEVKAGYERQVSLRSFVGVEDIVNTVLFLTSPHGKMISGQALGIDGHTETLTNY